MSVARSLARYLSLWIPLSLFTGVLAGTASAVLLVSLDYATHLREAHLWLVALLPVAGFAVGLLYHWYGRSVEAGSNLILEELHEEVERPQHIIPLRMTPLILLGTFLTHLFGGSAGREGTAIQAGASLADQLARLLRLQAGDRKLLLMAGIAAGFASVFGAPWAGAIFGLEVLGKGRLKLKALFPVLLAASAATLTTNAWHVHHTVYAIGRVAAPFVPHLLWTFVAGVIFGLVAMLFSQLTHGVTRAFALIRFAPLRPFVGGILVAGTVFSSHTTKYIGLGIPEIKAAFTGPVPKYEWLAKSLFTAVTLGSGFKGGEVTPLFFIGATAGNALSWLVPLPSALLAGLGFVAVFGGAANTPLAATVLAMELFGPQIGAYAGVACAVSYLCSGRTGIYPAQRHRSKLWNRERPSRS